MRTCHGLMLQPGPASHRQYDATRVRRGGGARQGRPEHGPAGDHHGGGQDECVTTVPGGVRAAPRHIRPVGAARGRHPHDPQEEHHPSRSQARKHTRNGGG